MVEYSTSDPMMTKCLRAQVKSWRVTSTRQWGSRPCSRRGQPRIEVAWSTAVNELTINTFATIEVRIATAVMDRLFAGLAWLLAPRGVATTAACELAWVTALAAAIG